MAIQNLGKVAVTPRGAWDATASYVVLDIVSANGSSYMAKTTVPVGTVVTNTTYWLVLAQAGNGIASIEKTGTSGNVDTYTITYTNGDTDTFTVTNSSLDEDVIAPAYDATVAYAAGVMFIHNGRLYYTIKNAPAGTSPTNTTYFREASVAGDFISIIKITDTTITLGDVNSILNGTGGINPRGLHIMFDVGALGASMYLCTIYLDTTTNVYKIFDLVLGRVAEGTYDATKLLTMCIANADTIATQSQIDALQKEINDLGGKTVVEDWDKLGDMIKDGTSTNVVSAGDITDINWIATVIGSTTNGLTVSCSNIDTFANGIGEAEAKTYLFVYNGSAWTYNEQAVNLADYAITVSGTPATGEVMTIQTTVTTRSYTFTGYDDVEAVDANVPHNWLMEQTYAPDTKAYDAIEACMVLAQGKTLAAGNYYWSAHLQGSDSLQTRYFTISADITATNADIQFAPTATNWTSPYVPTSMTPYYKGQTTALGSAIALSADEISGAVDVSTIDGVSVHDSTYQMAFGSNCWANSNIRQWLNDDTTGTFVAKSAWDRPSGYNYGAGFLFGIDPRVKALIQPAKVKWTAGYNAEGYTQGTTYTAEDKAFLLSMKEMSFNINTAEGEISDLYGEYTNNTLTNDAVAARAKYNKAGGTLNSYRWSRSANTSNAYDARNVASTGTNDSYRARGAHYVAPAFIIGKSTNP